MLEILTPSWLSPPELNYTFMDAGNAKKPRGGGFGGGGGRVAGCGRAKAAGFTFVIKAPQPMHAHRPVRAWTTRALFLEDRAQNSARSSGDPV